MRSTLLLRVGLGDLLVRRENANKSIACGKIHFHLCIVGRSRPERRHVYVYLFSNYFHHHPRSACFACPGIVSLVVECADGSRCLGLCLSSQE